MTLLKPFHEIDRELARRVANFLAGQHVPALRVVRVEAHNGVVTLSGRVRSFYEKQLSHHSAKRVAGVLQVIDEIEVAWPSKSDSHAVPVSRRPVRAADAVVQVILALPNPADRSPARSQFAD
jgi:hypothetical protein